MKMNRSLSVIDEDESKYDYDNDETNIVVLPPNIMSAVTMLLNILNEAYTKILDCLKGTNNI